MGRNKKKFGDRGEDLACEYLSSKGFQIIERNYRYGHGEIDIVAKDSEILVFVEVKSRKNLEFGYPEEAITEGKKQQIKRIASAYLYEHEIKDTDCRIDVVAILFRGKESPSISHIKNAF